MFTCRQREVNWGIFFQFFLPMLRKVNMHSSLKRDMNLTSLIK
jgi:hypothetical protein